MCGGRPHLQLIEQVTFIEDFRVAQPIVNEAPWCNLNGSVWDGWANVREPNNKNNWDQFWGSLHVTSLCHWLFRGQSKQRELEKLRPQVSAAEAEVSSLRQVNSMHVPDVVSKVDSITNQAVANRTWVVVGGTDYNSCAMWNGVSSLGWQSSVSCPSFKDPGDKSRYASGCGHVSFPQM